MQTKWLSSMVLVLVAAASFCRGEDWTTKDGKVYKGITVVKHDDATVTILDDDGGATIPLNKLPAALQQKFGYDPAKADAAVKAQADAEAKQAELQQEEAAREGRFSQWTTELKRKIDAEEDGATELVQHKGARAVDEAAFHEQAQQIISHYKVRLEALRALVAELDSENINQDFVQRVIDSTYNEEVFIGMPEAAVYIALGEPDKDNVTINGNGKSKQLIFKDRAYVYIDDGKVSSMQSP